MFDAHLRPAALSDKDLESLRIFGISKALIVAAHPPGRPTADAYFAHFDDAVGKQVRRLEAFGMGAKVLVGLSPQALPRRGLFEVLAKLPAMLSLPQVAGLGGAGLSTASPLELDAFEGQATWARDLKRPFLVVAPRRNDSLRLPTLLAHLRRLRLAPGRVLIEGVSLRNAASVLARGHWAAFRIHPDAATSEQAAAWVEARGASGVMLSTAAGLGASNLLGVARTEALMVRLRLPPAVIRRATTENPSQWLRNQPST